MVHRRLRPVGPAWRPVLIAMVRSAVRMRGLGAAEIAAAAGMTDGTVTALLRGRTRSRCETVLRVARVLDLVEDGTPRGDGQANGVNVRKARRSLRRLVEVERLPGEARSLVSDVAQSLGLPQDWWTRPLSEFEA